MKVTNESLKKDYKDDQKGFLDNVIAKWKDVWIKDKKKVELMLWWLEKCEKNGESECLHSFYDFIMKDEHVFFELVVQAKATSKVNTINGCIKLLNVLSSRDHVRRDELLEKALFEFKGELSTLWSQRFQVPTVVSLKMPRGKKDQVKTFDIKEGIDHGKGSELLSLVEQKRKKKFKVMWSDKKYSSILPKDRFYRSSPKDFLNQLILTASKSEAIQLNPFALGNIIPPRSLLVDVSPEVGNDLLDVLEMLSTNSSSTVVQEEICKLLLDTLSDSFFENLLLAVIEDRVSLNQTLVKKVIEKVETGKEIFFRTLKSTLWKNDCNIEKSMLLVRLLVNNSGKGFVTQNGLRELLDFICQRLDLSHECVRSTIRHVSSHVRLIHFCLYQYKEKNDLFFLSLLKDNLRKESLRDWEHHFQQDYKELLLYSLQNSMLDEFIGCLCEIVTHTNFFEADSDENHQKLILSIFSQNLRLVKKISAADGCKILKIVIMFPLTPQVRKELFPILEEEFLGITDNLGKDAIPFMDFFMKHMDLSSIISVLDRLSKCAEHKPCQNLLGISKVLLHISSFRFPSREVQEKVFSWFDQNIDLFLSFLSEDDPGVKSCGVQMLSHLFSYDERVKKAFERSYLPFAFMNQQEAIEQVPFEAKKVVFLSNWLQSKQQNDEIKQKLLPSEFKEFEKMKKNLEKKKASTFRPKSDFSKYQSGDMCLTETTKLNISRIESLLGDFVPLLLEGDTGVGKSSTIDLIAKTHGTKCIRFNMSSRIEIDDIMGKVVLDEDGKITFVSGPFTSAFEEGHWILFDELNLAKDEVLQSIENAISTKIITLKTLHDAQNTTRFVKQNPLFRLFATQNPSTGSFKGLRESLSPSFLSRFSVFRFEAMNDKELETVVSELLKKGLSEAMSCTHASKFVHTFHKNFSKICSRRPYATTTVRELLRVCDYVSKAHEFGDTTEECMNETIAYILWCVYGARFDNIKYRNKIANEIRKEYTKFDLKNVSWKSKDGLRFGKNDMFLIKKQNIAKDASDNRMQAVHNEIMEMLHSIEIIDEYGLYPIDESWHHAWKENVTDEFSEVVSGLSVYCAKVRSETIRSRIYEIFKVHFGPGGEANPKIMNTISTVAPFVVTERVRLLWKQLSLMVKIGTPVLIIGENGCGKSESMQAYANLLGKAVERCNLTPETEPSLLVGQLLPDTKKDGISISWKDGIITEAFLKGNWVLLDNLNYGDPQVLERMNSVLEKNPTWVLTEKPGEKDSLKMADGFKIFATLTPILNGVDPISPALYNRFAILQMDNLRTSELEFKQEIKHICKCLLCWKENIDVLADICWTIYHYVHQSTSLSKDLCTFRRLVRFINGIYSLEKDRKSIGHQSIIWSAYLICFDTEIGNIGVQLKKVIKEKLNGSQIHNISHKDFLNAQGQSEEYVLTEHRKRLTESVFGAIECKLPILLEGPAAVGKTSLIRYLASKLGMTLERVNNDENTNLQTYLGTIVPCGNKFVFKPGALTRAMKHGHWFLADEFNLADPTVMNYLFPVLEGKLTLKIPGTNEVIHCHPQFRFFATQNSSSYANRHELPKSLRNRFLEIQFPNFSEEELRTIINQRHPGLLSIEEVNRLASTYINIEEKRLLPISLRDLVKWMKRYQYFKRNLMEIGYQILSPKVMPSRSPEFCKTLGVNQEERVAILEIGSNVEFYHNDNLEVRIPGKLPKIFQSQDDIPLSFKQALVRLAFALHSNEPVLLVGPTSCKSFLIQTYVEITNRRETKMHLSAETETEELIGQLHPYSAIGLLQYLPLQLLDILDRLEKFHLIDKTKRDEIFDEIKDVIDEVKSIGEKSASSNDDGTSSEVSLGSDSSAYASTRNSCDDSDLDDSSSDCLSDVSEIEVTNTVKFPKGESDEEEIDAGSDESDEEDLFTETDYSFGELIVPVTERIEYLVKKILEIPNMSVIDMDSLNRVTTFAEELKSVKQSDQIMFCFRDGPVTQAIKSGNLLILEDFDSPSQAVTERLNSVLEPERSFSLPEDITLSNSNEVSIPDKFQIIATVHNTEGTSLGISPAARSRFTEIRVPEYSESDLKKIILNRLKRGNFLNDNEGKKSCDLIFSLKKEYDGFQNNLRQLLLWVDFILLSKYIPSMLAKVVTGAKFFLFPNEPTETQCDILKKWWRQKNMGSLPEEILNIFELPTEEHVREGLFTNEKQEVVLNYLRVSCPKNHSQDPKPNLTKSSNPFEATPLFIMQIAQLMAAVATKAPILLEGPPAVGKTFIVSQLATITGNEVERINMSASTTVEQLFGSIIPQEKDGRRVFEWKDGRITDALRNKKWILLDELNLAPSEVLDALSPLLNRDSSFIVPSTQEQLSHESLVFAAMNPTTVGGNRCQLPQSIKSLMVTVLFHELNDEELRLRFECVMKPLLITDKIVSKEDVDSLFKLQLKVRKEIRNGTIGRIGGPYEFNLRDLIKFKDIVAGNMKDQLCHHHAGNSSKKPTRDIHIASLRRFAEVVYAERFSSIADQNLVVQFIEEAFPLKSASFFEQVTLRKVDGGLRLGSIYVNCGNDEPVYNLPLCHTPELLKQLSLLASATNSKRTVLIEGPTSSRKTSIVLEFARLAGKKLVFLSMNQDTDVSDLIGQWIPCSNVVADNEKSHVTAEIKQATSKLLLLIKHYLKEEDTKIVIEGLRKTFNALNCSPLDGVLEMISILRTLQKLAIKHQKAFSKQLQHFEVLEQQLQNKSSTQFVFVESDLVKALRNGDWILFDNINAAPPNVIERLNSLFEQDPKLSLQENFKGEVLSRGHGIHEDSKIFATSNLERNSSNKLSSALTNRVLQLSFPSIDFNLNRENVKKHEVYRIAEHLLSEIEGGSELALIVCRVFERVKWMSVQKKVQFTESFVISFRKVLQCLEAFKSSLRSETHDGLLKSLFQSLNNTYIPAAMSPEDREIIMNIILDEITSIDAKKFQKFDTRPIVDQIDTLWERQYHDLSKNFSTLEHFLTKTLFSSLLGTNFEQNRHLLQVFFEDILFPLYPNHGKQLQKVEYLLNGDSKTLKTELKSLQELIYSREQVTIETVNSFMMQFKEEFDKAFCTFVKDTSLADAHERSKVLSLVNSVLNLFIALFSHPLLDGLEIVSETMNYCTKLRNRIMLWLRQFDQVTNPIIEKWKDSLVNDIIEEKSVRFHFQLLISSPIFGSQFSLSHLQNDIRIQQFENIYSWIIRVWSFNFRDRSFSDVLLTDEPFSLREFQLVELFLEKKDELQNALKSPSSKISDDLRCKLFPKIEEFSRENCITAEKNFFEFFSSEKHLNPALSTELLASGKYLHLSSVVDLSIIDVNFLRICSSLFFQGQFSEFKFFYHVVSEKFDSSILDYDKVIVLNRMRNMNFSFNRYSILVMDKTKEKICTLLSYDLPEIDHSEFMLDIKSALFGRGDFNNDSIASCKFRRIFEMLDHLLKDQNENFDFSSCSQMIRKIQNSVNKQSQWKSIVPFAMFREQMEKRTSNSSQHLHDLQVTFGMVMKRCEEYREKMSNLDATQKIRILAHLEKRNHDIKILDESYQDYQHFFESFIKSMSEEETNLWMTYQIEMKLRYINECIFQYVLLASITKWKNLRDRNEDLLNICDELSKRVLVEDPNEFKKSIEEGFFISKQKEFSSLLEFIGFDLHSQTINGLEKIISDFESLGSVVESGSRSHATHAENLSISPLHAIRDRFQKLRTSCRLLKPKPSKVINEITEKIENITTSIEEKDFHKVMLDEYENEYSKLREKYFYCKKLTKFDPLDYITKEVRLLLNDFNISDICCGIRSLSISRGRRQIDNGGSHLGISLKQKLRELVVEIDKVVNPNQKKDQLLITILQHNLKENSWKVSLNAYFSPDDDIERFKSISSTAETICDEMTYFQWSDRGRNADDTIINELYKVYVNERYSTLRNESVSNHMGCYGHIRDEQNLGKVASIANIMKFLENYHGLKSSMEKEINDFPDFVSSLLSPTLLQISDLFILLAPGHRYGKICWLNEKLTREVDWDFKNEHSPRYDGRLFHEEEVLKSKSHITFLEKFVELISSKLKRDDFNDIEKSPKFRIILGLGLLFAVCDAFSKMKLHTFLKRFIEDINKIIQKVFPMDTDDPILQAKQLHDLLFSETIPFQRDDGKPNEDLLKQITEKRAILSKDIQYAGKKSAQEAIEFFCNCVHLATVTIANSLDNLDKVQCIQSSKKDEYQSNQSMLENLANKIPSTVQEIVTKTFKNEKPNFEELNSIIQSMEAIKVFNVESKILQEASDSLKSYFESLLYYCCGYIRDNVNDQTLYREYLRNIRFSPPKDNNWKKKIDLLKSQVHTQTSVIRNILHSTICFDYDPNPFSFLHKISGLMDEYQGELLVLSHLILQLMEFYQEWGKWMEDNARLCSADFINSYMESMELMKQVITFPPDEIKTSCEKFLSLVENFTKVFCNVLLAINEMVGTMEFNMTEIRRISLELLSRSFRLCFDIQKRRLSNISTFQSDLELNMTSTSVVTTDMLLKVSIKSLIKTAECFQDSLITPMWISATEVHKNFVELIERMEDIVKNGDMNEESREDIVPFLNELYFFQDKLYASISEKLQVSIQGISQFYEEKRALFLNDLKQIQEICCEKIDLESKRYANNLIRTKEMEMSRQIQTEKSKLAKYLQYKEKKEKKNEMEKELFDGLSDIVELKRSDPLYDLISKEQSFLKGETKYIFHYETSEPVDIKIAISVNEKKERKVKIPSGTIDVHYYKQNYTPWFSPSRVHLPRDVEKKGESIILEKWHSVSKICFLIAKGEIGSIPIPYKKSAPSIEVWQTGKLLETITPKDASKKLYRKISWFQTKDIGKCWFEEVVHFERKAKRSNEISISQQTVDQLVESIKKFSTVKPRKPRFSTHEEIDKYFDPGQMKELQKTKIKWKQDEMEDSTEYRSIQRAIKKCMRISKALDEFFQTDSNHLHSHFLEFPQVIREIQEIRIKTFEISDIVSRVRSQLALFAQLQFQAACFTFCWRFTGAKSKKELKLCTEIYDNKGILRKMYENTDKSTEVFGIHHQMKETFPKLKEVYQWRRDLLKQRIEIKNLCSSFVLKDKNEDVKNRFKDLPFSRYEKLFFFRNKDDELETTPKDKIDVNFGILILNDIYHEEKRVLVLENMTKCSHEISFSGDGKYFKVPKPFQSKNSSINEIVIVLDVEACRRGMDQLEKKSFEEKRTLSIGGLKKIEVHFQVCMSTPVLNYPKELDFGVVQVKNPSSKIFKVANAMSLPLKVQFQVPEMFSLEPEAQTIKAHSHSSFKLDMKVKEPMAIDDELIMYVNSQACQRKMSIKGEAAIPEIQLIWNDQAVNQGEIIAFPTLQSKERRNFNFWLKNTGKLPLKSVDIKSELDFTCPSEMIPIDGHESLPCEIGKNLDQGKYLCELRVNGVNLLNFWIEIQRGEIELSISEEKLTYEIDIKTFDSSKHLSYDLCIENKGNMKDEIQFKHKQFAFELLHPKGQSSCALEFGKPLEFSLHENESKTVKCIYKPRRELLSLEGKVLIHSTCMRRKVIQLPYSLHVNQGDLNFHRTDKKKEKYIHFGVLEQNVEKTKKYRLINKGKGLVKFMINSAMAIDNVWINIKNPKTDEMDLQKCSLQHGKALHIEITCSGNGTGHFKGELEILCENQFQLNDDGELEPRVLRIPIIGGFDEDSARNVHKEFKKSSKEKPEAVPEPIEPPRALVEDYSDDELTDTSVDQYLSDSDYDSGLDEDDADLTEEQFLKLKNSAYQKIKNIDWSLQRTQVCFEKFPINFAETKEFSLSDAINHIPAIMRSSRDWMILFNDICQLVRSEEKIEEIPASLCKNVLIQGCQLACSMQGIKLCLKEIIEIPLLSQQLSSIIRTLLKIRSEELPDLNRILSSLDVDSEERLLAFFHMPKYPQTKENVRKLDLSLNDPFAHVSDLYVVNESSDEEKKIKFQSDEEKVDRMIIKEQVEGFVFKAPDSKDFKDIMLKLDLQNCSFQSGIVGTQMDPSKVKMDLQSFRKRKDLDQKIIRQFTSGKQRESHSQQKDFRISNELEATMEYIANPTDVQYSNYPIDSSLISEALKNCNIRELYKNAERVRSRRTPGTIDDPSPLEAPEKVKKWTYELLAECQEIRNLASYVVSEFRNVFEEFQNYLDGSDFEWLILVDNSGSMSPNMNYTFEALVSLIEIFRKLEFKFAVGKFGNTDNQRLLYSNFGEKPEPFNHVAGEKILESFSFDEGTHPATSLTKFAEKLWTKTPSTSKTLRLAIMITDGFTQETSITDYTDLSERYDFSLGLLFIQDSDPNSYIDLRDATAGKKCLEVVSSKSIGTLASILMKLVKNMFKFKLEKEIEKEKNTSRNDFPRKVKISIPDIVSLKPGQFLSIGEKVGTNPSMSAIQKQGCRKLTKLFDCGRSQEPLSSEAEENKIDLIDLDSQMKELHDYYEYINDKEYLTLLSKANEQWNSAVAKISGNISKLTKVFEDWVFPSNEFTRRKADFHGNALHIPGLIKAISTDFTYKKYFSSKKGGSKRNYGVCIVLDVSQSMNGHVSDCAIESICMLISALQKCQIEKFSIITFGSEVKLVKTFDIEFNEKVVYSLLRSLRFDNQYASVDGDAIHVGLELFSRSLHRGGKKMFVISDGCGTCPTMLIQSLKRAEELNIEVIGLGIGHDRFFLPCYYPNWILASTPETLSDGIRCFYQSEISHASRKAQGFDPSQIKKASAGKNISEIMDSFEDNKVFKLDLSNERELRLDSSGNVSSMTIQLCFVIDCTGSMGPWIYAVKQQILDIVKGIIPKIAEKYPSLMLDIEFSAVLFKDFCDKERIASIPFTKDQDQFISNIQSIRTSGGGDIPEDVLGALNYATHWGKKEETWTAKARFMVLLTDAPCHGMNLGLHDDRPDGVTDEYTKEKLNPKVVMKNLSDKSIDFFICQIRKDLTQDMVNAFKNFYKDNGHDITTVDLVNGPQAIQPHFHFVFVLDESGSMCGRRWNELEQSYRVFLSQRKNDQGIQDRVSIIQFASSGRIVSKNVLLEKAPSGLYQKSGGTNFYAGLSLVSSCFDGTSSGCAKMVIFMTDGESNCDCRNLCQGFARDGIDLRVVSFGVENSAYDKRLKQLAKDGNGSFYKASVGELANKFAQISSSCNDMNDRLIKKFGESLGNALNTRISMNYL